MTVIWIIHVVTAGVKILHRSVDSSATTVHVVSTSTDIVYVIYICEYLCNHTS